jgi:hypothetical protein
VDRVAAAQERLWSARRELALVELLCADCRYLRGSKCRHPSVETYSVDPVRGGVTANPVEASFARSGNGQCGPEAALFDPKAQWQAAIVGMGIGLKRAALICTAIFMVGFWIVYLLVQI